MTQLPRIGSKIRSSTKGWWEDDWKVVGTVEDHSGGHQPRALLIEGPYGRTVEISAREYRQHWTPATQRNNP